MDFARESSYLIGQFRIVGQFAKTERHFLHRIGRRSQLGAKGPEFGIGNAMLADTFPGKYFGQAFAVYGVAVVVEEGASRYSGSQDSPKGDRR